MPGASDLFFSTMISLMPSFLNAMTSRRQSIPAEVLSSIFLLLLSLAKVHEHLQSSQQWWIQYGVLPFYCFLSRLITNISLINAYILLIDNIPLTPSSLFDSVRHTWRHMASAMFYQNLARQNYRLALWVLQSTSTVLPAWLWWIDAVAKPARLAVHLILLFQEMAWVVCLALLALTILGLVRQQQPVTIRAGFWFDNTPWRNLADEVLRQQHIRGFLLSCCFTAVAAVYRGMIMERLPTVIRHLPTCAGTLLVFYTYTQFALTNFMTYNQMVRSAASVVEEASGLNSPPAQMQETETAFS